MLKKIAHIIFAALIFIGTVGMTISKHYCGTSLKSISVNISPDNCCDESSDCCRNESFTIQLEDDFSIVSSNFDFNILSFTLNSFSELIQSEKLDKNLFSNVYYKGSPPKIQEVLSKLQVYLL